MSERARGAAEWGAVGGSAEEGAAGDVGRASGVEFSLEFRDVTFSYGTAPVIEGLSLALPAAGVTGIVGPNGCGKSTLLKLADGLLEPSSGEVLAFGRHVSALPARERARLVALLPQVHRTPSMSVRELVMCGRYAHMGVFGRPGPDDWAAVDEALAEVGIGALAHKPARGLSGGERQRAFIAMAIAQDARALMLDEPTTYLDVRAAQETMGIARQLAERKGVAVIAVIHDLDLAFRSCDRLVVMARGAVRAEGAPDDEDVVRAVGDAFGVDVCRAETQRGPVFAFFPREQAGADAR